MPVYSWAKGAPVHEQQFAQTQQQRMIQTLAPQMRQALEYLQAPLLELGALIRREIEQNPTLEEKSEDHASLEIDPGDPAGGDEDVAAFEDEYRKLSELDASWREYFRMAGAGRGGSSPEEEERRRHMLESLVREESLQSRLMTQIDLTDLEGRDRDAAVLLIGSLDDDGYLNATLGELSETSSLSMETLEQALAVVQDLDPAGVGARDLRECLAIQLRRLGLPDGALEMRVVMDHLDDLAADRHSEIAKALSTPVATVYEAAKTIASLEPKPGRAFDGGPPEYVVPDVVVQKIGDEYVVAMNNDRLPRVRISRQYRQLMEDSSTPKETRAYIRDKIRAGAFMIRSIHQRQETVAGIAREIVRAQREFLDRGLGHLRPLKMSEVAAVVGVHETTVSRAVSGKYMQTPRGLFEMRFFFSSGYRAPDGNSVSNKAVKDAITELIEAENVACPLSDDAIVRRLAERGLKVARRTIAKYRDEMGIPPSHERRA